MPREIYSTKTYIGKEEKSHVNNIMSHLKNLEKEEKTKSKANRKKDIIKIKKEIHNIFNINETKS